MKKCGLILLVFLLRVYAALADVISEVAVENPDYAQQHTLAWTGVSLSASLMLFFMLRLRNRGLPLKNLLKMPVFFINLALLLGSLTFLAALKKNIAKEMYVRPERRPENLPQDTLSDDTTSRNP